MVEYRGIIICVPLYICSVLVLGVSITAGLFVFHVAVVPLVFKYSKTFRRNVVFANFIQWPPGVDFDRPAAFGLEGCRNLTKTFHSKVDNCPVTIDALHENLIKNHSLKNQALVKIEDDGLIKFEKEYLEKISNMTGVWHILPKSSLERLRETLETETDEEELKDIIDDELYETKLPVVMYCHGNSNSRAAAHRVDLYKFFQEMDFHTIAFDYRGYGDSTDISPSEEGVVEDALMIYEWITNILNKGYDKPPVFIWGHSLGTGIASHMLGNLKELSHTWAERWQVLPLPNGLILEAPFNNLADEVAHHPLSKLVTWLPYFEQAFVEPFHADPEYAFRSDAHLRDVTTLPVLILHAQDDAIVPLDVGKKLYQSILEARRNGGALVKLHEYPKCENLGHKWICHAKDLHKVVGIILATGASITASVLVLQVAVLPLVFKFSKSVQRKMVFSNCINFPRNLDYKNPLSSNIIGGRHFMIEFQSDVDACPIKLGVWHIIPVSMFREVIVIRDYQTLDARLHSAMKKTKKPIVLYCHGNSNHRASPHRLQMYKVFQELDFHIITYDYRGYGDSTHVRPTEAGVVEDCLAVYAWLLDALEYPKPPVLLWGHSLGTAVASNMVAHLEELCRRGGKECLAAPDALVLEAPFNNLVEEIQSHPLSKLVSWLPYYKETFVKPFIASSEYSFTTDQYLPRATHIPILILHSKADRVVPHELATKLYEAIKSSRSEKNAPVVFHTFDNGNTIGHNNLCEAPELKTVVMDFLDLIQNKKGS